MEGMEEAEPGEIDSWPWVDHTGCGWDMKIIGGRAEMALAVM